MKLLTIVWAKEVLDNLRDRRTLLSSLIFGPLFGPILFVFMMNFMLDEATSDVDELLELPVSGQEHAPELIRWLGGNGVNVVPGPVDAREAVSRGDMSVVLIIPDSIGEQMRAGQPAPLQLVVNNAKSRDRGDVRKARNLLRAYRNQLAASRLRARGINPLVLYPVVIDEVDVSTAVGRALVVLGMLTYFILFSMLMGGMYLAIDTTAGERERGSLEPLLTLPVPTGQLILGKVAATCTFMLVALAVTVTAFSISLNFLDLQALDMQANFGPVIALSVFAVMLPFTLFGAGMMTLVASFTRSYKEAQTYLTIVLLVPTLPIIFAAIFSLDPTFELMAVPSLSQHLLITAIMKGEALQTEWILVSAASTLLAGALFIWLASFFYRRESILG
ncbi:MAG: ABC transporter permease [Proteobacteria bacterium]|nr:ABC transporter permease [Pseudomonadota bacterium]